VKRRDFCACCAGLAAWPPAAKSQDAGPQDGLPQALELGLDRMRRIDRRIWVAPLAPRVWLYTATDLIDGGVYFPANGLVVERDGGSLLVDTGWDAAQAQALVAWSKTSLPAPITEAIGTHFHRDRIGGVNGLQRLSVPARAHPLTCELARSRGFTAPEPIHGFVESWRLGEDCELYFPGAGHTWDNIAVWLPRATVLYGGCFLKSRTSKDLGNLADADVGEWRTSLKRLSDRYPGRRIVVPGHGTIAGDAIAHTLALLPS
jgi:glyoxylase-like metal-dependent hydrolase (beta-lactamase superfamily II)